MKRLFSISIIIFLLGVTSFPIVFWSNSDFVYAESEQEELTTEEIIEAGIIAYLNQRGAWIVNTTGASIYTVKAVMNSWINSYEFWKNTNVGSAAVLASNIIIKYSPFRVSLKGPAVRAFNDLVQWLKDSGKIPNAENSNGGETTDNIYDGYLVGNSLYYVVNTSASGSAFRVSPSAVKIGMPYNGYNHTYFVNYFNNTTHQVVDYNDLINESVTVDETDITLSLPSPAGNKTTDLYYDSRTGDYLTYSPRLILVGTGSAASASGTVYCIRDRTVIGCVAMVHVISSSAGVYNAACVVSYDSTANSYSFRHLYKYTANVQGQSNANVNLDTDGFEKTDPSVPDNDDEITYTPKVKETTGNYTQGDTFNTYNEYITNYVTKNTYIEASESEEPEEPGGTTPPWTDDNQGTSGTLTPNGNGGYDLSLPDLTLPDLDIDWSINGLKEKFPFSIPWDLMAFFTVLNAEPETPHFEGTIPIGIWEWEIDWDLHYFDNLAILVRNLEFIAFCIGLIIVTRNIIKG